MNDNPSEETEHSPTPESLTVEEKERFLARVRSEGRTLSSAEMYSLFGPPPEPAPPPRDYGTVTEMTVPPLSTERLAQLVDDFFADLGGPLPAAPPLVRGVIFDFDDTLATRTRPLLELMAEGARAADTYMRATGMTLPDQFDTKIVEARRFSEKKSADEQEEHLADDAMSFLLQFFGYPASRMDPQVLQQAVDHFYAPEMSAWTLRPGAREMLAALRSAGYKLALLTNHSCDRAFQQTVDTLGLRPYFDLCLSSSSVEYRKPDPRFLQIALDRWACLPYEVVVVGDSLHVDIRCGIELGAQTVLVHGTTDPQVLHDNEQLADTIHPDATLETLHSLPDIVRAWR